MLRLASCLILALTLASAFAAPRVGEHPTFTRVVLDLPRAATPRVTHAPGEVRVSLDVTLPPEQGALRGVHVTSYDVRRGGAASVLTLRFPPGRAANVGVYPATEAVPARLVVDVGAAVTKSPAAPVARPSSLQGPPRPKLRVVLDPGHGGRDTGMAGFVVEEEVTLDVARRVRAHLAPRGVDIVMTRDADAHLSPDKRTDLDLRARMANAGTVNAFVSIHVNAASPSASGIETYTFGRPLEANVRRAAVQENGGGVLGEALTRASNSAADQLLGDLFAQSIMTYSNKLARSVQDRLVKATGAVNRGVARDLFYVIRFARTPAILVEIGFGTHPIEGKKLSLAAYRERVATAIADGVLAFLNVSN